LSWNYAPAQDLEAEKEGDPMKPEHDIDTAPGGLTVWRNLFGGSIIWGRLKFFVFIGAFLLIGGLIVAFVPI
jgi:hypothetical protein